MRVIQKVSNGGPILKDLYEQNQRVRSWRIDSVNGSDSAPGDAANPLRTWRELRDRLGPSPILARAGATTVTVAAGSDLSAEDIGFEGVPVQAQDFIVQGEPTVLATGTLTAAQTPPNTLNPGNLDAQVTDGALVEWGALLYNFIRLTSGAGAGASAFLGSQDPAGAGNDVARTSGFTNLVTRSQVVPVGTETYEVVSFPRIGPLTLSNVDTAFNDQLIFDSLYIGSVSGDFRIQHTLGSGRVFLRGCRIDAFDIIGGSVPEILGCGIVAPFSTVTLRQLESLLIRGCYVGGATPGANTDFIMSACSNSAFSFNPASSSVTQVQGTLSIFGGQVNVDGLGIYGGTQGLQVNDGVAASSTRPVYGDDHAGFGIKCLPGSGYRFQSGSVPTIAGTTGESQIGLAAPVAYAAWPAGVVQGGAFASVNI